MSTNVISLKTVLCGEPQAAFDLVGERLLRQGASCRENGSCAYSDGFGQHCAVGLILDQTELDVVKARELNGVSVGTLAANLGYIESNWTDVPLLPELNLSNLQMLRDVQNVHDNREESDSAQWRSEVFNAMRAVANDNQLSTTKLEEVYNELRG
jgi:hypothetical protein